MLAILHGMYRDNHKLEGIEKKRLARSTDDASNPCCEGERSRSSEISGSRRPRIIRTERDVATHELRDPTTTHL